MSARLAIAVVVLGACAKKESNARAPAPVALECDALTGDNPVQTEMRKLECALQQVIAAIGRDDLAAVPEWMHVVHAAKQQTEESLRTGTYQLPRDDLSGFVAMDETFHAALETLVEAANAGDAAATATALGQTLAQCQSCHAAFRPTRPRSSRP